MTLRDEKQETFVESRFRLHEALALREDEAPQSAATALDVLHHEVSALLASPSELHLACVDLLSNSQKRHLRHFEKRP